MSRLILVKLRAQTVAMRHGMYTAAARLIFRLGYAQSLVLRGFVPELSCCHARNKLNHLINRPEPH
jgi:hypothetical protein